MPFKSQKQRAYLHANEPAVAKKWEKDYPTRGQRTATNRQRQQAKAIRGY
jgi:hypothetical protein